MGHDFLTITLKSASEMSVPTHKHAKCSTFQDSLLVFFAFHTPVRNFLAH